MENIYKFTQDLANIIASRRDEFNKTILPQVQKNYAVQTTALKAIRGILLKKGLIHDDPYRYDSKLSDIVLPDTTAFPDGERTSALGTRLAHYELMLDFLNSYYQFNTVFLTPKRTATLLALNATFLWDSFSSATNHVNTKALNALCRSLYLSSDNLNTSLMKDALHHMGKTSGMINAGLKDLAYLHRQEYKLKIRQEVIPHLDPKIKLTPEQPADGLKHVKKVFAERLKKVPFYKDLIQELITEDYGTDSVSIQQSVLHRLATRQRTQKKEEQPINLRTILTGGLRILSNSSSQFYTVLEKIRQNQESISRAHDGFFSKFLRMLKEAFNIKERSPEIIIQIEDPVTQLKKREVIVLEEFEKELASKIRVFKNINTPGSPVVQKLARMRDSELLDLLTAYITECNALIRKMDGLDGYYKGVSPELRSRIRGIKIEITTIKNSIIRANQARAEFSAYVEEQEQMKKLKAFHE